MVKLEVLAGLFVHIIRIGPLGYQFTIAVDVILRPVKGDGQVLVLTKGEYRVGGLEFASCVVSE